MRILVLLSLLFSTLSFAHLHGELSQKEVVSYTDKTDVKIELINLYNFPIDFAVTVDGEYRGNTGEFSPGEADHIHIMLDTRESGIKRHRVCTKSVSATVCTDFFTERY